MRHSKKWLQMQQVVIVNYDRIAKYSDHLTQMEWTGIVMDESHYCKGGSQRTRACLALLAKAAPEYTLLLSGTPVMNSPREIIHQLRLIDRINEFGGPIHFLNRYCNVVNVDMTKMPKLPKPDENGNIPTAVPGDMDLRDQMIRKMYENQVELNKNLRSTCYVRREKEDALPQLPDKMRTSIFLDITNREEYERAERDVVSFLQDRVSKDEKFLAKINHLSKEKQVRAIKERRAEIGFRSARAEMFARIEATKQVAAIGKLDAAQNWMANVLENGEKLVMFAHHNNIIDELHARFPKGTTVHRGGMSDEKRQEAIDKFQEEGEYKGNTKYRLFLGSLSMAVGYTVTKSSTPAFMELGWNPAKHDQAEDRCHRIGQKNAVNAYYLIAKGTIEEWIAKKIESKRLRVDATAFGDPLGKVAAQGDILGDLVNHLIGRKMDPRLDFTQKMEDAEKGVPTIRKPRRSTKKTAISKTKKKVVKKVIAKKPAAKKPVAKKVVSKKVVSKKKRSR
jgi:SWI/SNF-related matrix-associated actin-dependent regulator 1 of chromatin subfamily A